MLLKVESESSGVLCLNRARRERIMTTSYGVDGEKFKSAFQFLARARSSSYDSACIHTRAWAAGSVFLVFANRVAAVIMALVMLRPDTRPHAPPPFAVMRL